MSPEAIQSLIEMFGVEKGVQILNLFTVQPDEIEDPDAETSEESIAPELRPRPLRARRRETPAETTEPVTARETVIV